MIPSFHLESLRWEETMNAKFLGTFVVALLTSVAALGQGTILFNTRTGTIDAPVHDFSGAPAGAFGAGVRAQLFHFTGQNSRYIPLYPTTTFRSTSWAAMAYVVQPPEPVIVPGIPAGSQATVVMRVWVGEDYSTAHYFGQSNPVTVTLGGNVPGSAPLPPALLIGLQGFTTLIPEPSISALFVAGLVALGCWLRK